MTFSSSLLSLLKKNSSFLWGKEQEDAFLKIKDCLTKAPVLALPDFDKTFEIECDAWDSDKMRDILFGTGGTYLAFVTGNLTSIKAPSALSAMENANVKPGSEEGEVISTVAIATSSIVTTIVIVIGVVALSYLAPILNSTTLKPAFDNILPALFGGLAVVYVSKNWKLAIAPLVFMVVLFLFVPSLASSVGVLVPVGVLIALGAARIMYKKGVV